MEGITKYTEKYLQICCHGYLFWDLDLMKMNEPKNNKKVQEKKEETEELRKLWSTDFVVLESWVSFKSMNFTTIFKLKNNYLSHIYSSLTRRHMHIISDLMWIFQFFYWPGEEDTEAQCAIGWVPRCSFSWYLYGSDTPRELLPNMWWVGGKNR